jgi:hypothetical protein
MYYKLKRNLSTMQQPTQSNQQQQQQFQYIPMQATGGQPAGAFNQGMA